MKILSLYCDTANPSVPQTTTRATIPALISSASLLQDHAIVDTDVDIGFAASNNVLAVNAVATMLKDVADEADGEACCSKLDDVAAALPSQFDQLPLSSGPAVLDPVDTVEKSSGDVCGQGARSSAPTLHCTNPNVPTTHKCLLAANPYRCPLSRRNYRRSWRSEGLAAV